MLYSHRPGTNRRYSDRKRWYNRQIARTTIACVLILIGLFSWYNNVVINVTSIGATTVLSTGNGGGGGGTVRSSSPSFSSSGATSLQQNHDTNGRENVTTTVSPAIPSSISSYGIVQCLTENFIQINNPSVVFYPRRFFQKLEYDGSGYPWTDHYKHTVIDLKLSSRFILYENISIPDIITPLASDDDINHPIKKCPSVSMTMTTMRTTTATTSTLIYYHIHKNGGGSMAHLVLPSQSTKFNSDLERQIGYDQYSQKCQSYMNEVYTRNNNDNDNNNIIINRTRSDNSILDLNVIIFTFTRDPVHRFLSSLGQILRGPIGIIKRTIAPCHAISMTTSQLIDCVLTKMEQKAASVTNSKSTGKDKISDTATTTTNTSGQYHYFPSYLDQHFAPQVYELFHGLFELDIGVVVLDMEASLSNVIVQLNSCSGDDRGSIRNCSNRGDGRSSSFRSGPHINTAIGVVDNYPQFNLIPSILTSQMKDRICRLYEMDVMMIREMGFLTATTCIEPTVGG